MIEIFSLILFIFLLFNFYLNRDYRYPPFLFSLIWFFIITFYMLIIKTEFIRINEISTLSLSIFTGGVFFFSLGGITAYFTNNKIYNKKIIKKISINKTVDTIFFILPIIFLPLYIFQAIKISDSTGIDNFFMGLRWGLNYGDQSYGYLRFFATFSIFNTIYRILIISRYKEILTVYKNKAYISLIITLIYSILSTGRTGLLFLLLSLLGIAAINKSLSLKKIFISIISFLVLFFTYSIVLNKGGSLDDSLYANLFSVSEVVLEYIFGSLAAFDHFIHTFYNVSYGESTFRLFYVLLEKLSIIDTTPIKLVQPFINIPFQTNVYTIYKYYINDFDIMGSMIIIYIIGYFHSFLYFNLYKNMINQLFYILLLYPLIFSFFQDQYFSLLSMWMQYYIFTLITFKYIIKIKGAK